VVKKNLKLQQQMLLQELWVACE